MKEKVKRKISMAVLGMLGSGIALGGGFFAGVKKLDAGTVLIPETNASIEAVRAGDYNRTSTSIKIKADKFYQPDELAFLTLTNGHRILVELIEGAEFEEILNFKLQANNGTGGPCDGTDNFSLLTGSKTRMWAEVKNATCLSSNRTWLPNQSDLFKIRILPNANQVRLRIALVVSGPPIQYYDQGEITLVSFVEQVRAGEKRDFNATTLSAISGFKSFASGNSTNGSLTLSNVTGIANPLLSNANLTVSLVEPKEWPAGVSNIIVDSTHTINATNRSVNLTHNFTQNGSKTINITLNLKGNETVPNNLEFKFTVNGSFNGAYPKTYFDAVSLGKLTYEGINLFIPFFRHGVGHTQVRLTTTRPNTQVKVFAYDATGAQKEIPNPCRIELVNGTVTTTAKDTINPGEICLIRSVDYTGSLGDRYVTQLLINVIGVSGPEALSCYAQYFQTHGPQVIPRRIPCKSERDKTSYTE